MTTNEREPLAKCLPWSVVHYADDPVLGQRGPNILDSAGMVITGQTDDMDDAQPDAADSEAIVKAVNAHDKLVKLVEGCADVFGTWAKQYRELGYPKSADAVLDGQRMVRDRLREIVK